MILEILAATMALTNLNTVKPATTHTHKSYTPVAIDATSGEAQNIILNSYYIDMPWEKLIETWTGYDEPSTASPWISRIIKNRSHF